MGKNYDRFYDSPCIGKNDYLEIGNRIRANRKKMGMSLAELAQEINSNYRTVSRHELGGSVKLEMLARYSAVFGIPIWDLLPDRISNPSNQSFQSIDRKLNNWRLRLNGLPSEKQAMLLTAIDSIFDITE